MFTSICINHLSSREVTRLRRAELGSSLHSKVNYVPIHPRVLYVPLYYIVFLLNDIFLLQLQFLCWRISSVYSLIPQKRFKTVLWCRDGRTKNHGYNIRLHSYIFYSKVAVSWEVGIHVGNANCFFSPSIPASSQCYLLVCFFCCFELWIVS